MVFLYHQMIVMIAQWDSSLPVLPVARVQFPATAEYFKGFFPGWSLWSTVLATVLLEEDSGPTSAKTNLENILHKGESANREMDAIFKKMILAVIHLGMPLNLDWY